MIIEKPFETGDVISVKLSSGEEIIARLEKKGEKSLSVKKPLMLVAGPDGGMGLAPFMFTVNPAATFKLQMSSIICTVKTDDETAKTYTQQTSGIVTV